MIIKIGLFFYVLILLVDKKVCRKTAELCDKLCSPTWTASSIREHWNQQLSQRQWMAYLLSKIWHIHGCFFSLIWHFPNIILCIVIFLAQTPLLLFSLDGNTEGHLVYHLLKEVPYAGCLAEWACLAMSLPIWKPVKLFSLGFCHQHNLCFVMFVFYFFTSLISLWQDVWTNTQDNKLQSVKPCVPMWHSFSSIRNEEIMLTCLWIRHNCLTHMHLLQLAPTPYSTQCGMPITILHILKMCP
jgi:hypothetical protein